MNEKDDLREVEKVLTPDVIDKVLETLKDEFNSHDFIEEFIKSEPKKYMRLVEEYWKKIDENEKQKPISEFLFGYLHGNIGSHLYNSRKMEWIGRVDSENIFGRLSKCSRWRKKQ
ncbi:MAG: hypothetical protein LBL74_04110 [Bacteroidales bacterium]|jgi:hypothetical protein|nr:hypothetical protein [Bacteroidales bacterium]